MIPRFDPTPRWGGVTVDKCAVVPFDEDPKPNEDAAEMEDLDDPRGFGDIFAGVLREVDKFS